MAKTVVLAIMCVLVTLANSLPVHHPRPSAATWIPLTPDEQAAEWETELKQNLEGLISVMRKADPQKMKYGAMQGLGHLKYILKKLDWTRVKMGLKQINLESMVKGLNLEGKLKELALEKKLKSFPAEHIAESIIKELDLEGYLVKESLKDGLEKLFQDLDVNALMQGVHELLKGVDVVSVARSLDSMVHGMDFDVLINSVENLLTALQNTIRDMDLKGLLKLVEELLTRVKELDLSKLLRGLTNFIEDVRKMGKLIKVEHLVRAIDGMIKSGDLDYIKTKMLTAMGDLKTTLEDLENLDLQQLKDHILEGLDHMKTELKDISIEAFVKGIDLDEMFADYDLQVLFKVVEEFLEDFLKDWALDRVLKDLDLDKIVKDAFSIVNSFTELVKSSDLKAFVSGCMGIVTKSLDFDNFQLAYTTYLQGLNVDNIVEGYKKMFIGMNFVTIRNGVLNIIKALKSLVRGVIDLLTGLKFNFSSQDVTDGYHREGIFENPFPKSEDGSIEEAIANVLNYLANGR